MKKIILVASLVVFSVAKTNAQSVKFGIKAGLNYANELGSDIKINSLNYETTAITSFHAGFVANIGLFKGVAFQPELLYSTQGASYKNAVAEIINEIGYLSIPAIVKINLSKAISLELGPQASFLVSDKKDFVAKDPSTFDFSAVGGLGYKITDGLFIQARYVLGLTEISTDAKTKNSVVQISAGILF
jgi:hypothetical protein